MLYIRQEASGWQQCHSTSKITTHLQVWVRLKRLPVLVDVARAVAHAVAVLAQDDGARLACGTRAKA